MNNISGNYVSNNGAGISILLSNENNITHNNVSSNLNEGIHLVFADWNYIWENNASTNNEMGISLKNSNYNNITSNEASNNIDGIKLEESHVNNITDNNASINSINGIYLYRSNENHIIKNILLSNVFGIHFFISSNNNKLTSNNISGSSYGIDFYSSMGNEIRNNNISNNNRGIHFWFSSNNNNVNENIISFNTLMGIYLENSNGNMIYRNNFIENTDQAFDTEDDNYWDNGYPSGGNYWSDYDGIDLNSTPNQNVPPPDGIGDTPYVIDADSQDNFPLMEPYTSKTFENYTILKPGWNLISIPLIQTNQNLIKVLEMIDGYYDAVQWYNITDINDPWMHYKVGKPFGNDLSRINESMGFWIHITQPGDTIFIYNGTQPTINQTISLIPGWNLVGYPSLTIYNRTDGLNNIDFGNDVDAIWTYNATTQKWKEITASDNFEVGRGYWMHSKVTKTWIVPL
jgi:parallel beta-helix repeat protein